MPPDHARILRERRPLSHRQKLLGVGAALSVIIALVITLLLSTGTTTRPGCISTYLPGVVGAQTVDECGAEARRTCATLRGSTQYGSVGVLILEKSCRQGRLPVG